MPGYVLDQLQGNPFSHQPRQASMPQIVQPGPWNPGRSSRLFKPGCYLNIALNI